jgi:hypothetical protein
MIAGEDATLRPSGYEPDELPDRSTPHQALRQATVARLRELMG